LKERDFFWSEATREKREAATAVQPERRDTGARGFKPEESSRAGLSKAKEMNDARAG
jgi:hypothetical protein